MSEELSNKKPSEEKSTEAKKVVFDIPANIVNEQKISAEASIGTKIFSSNKLSVLSEISRDIGQVFFASLVVGVFLSDKNIWLILTGILFSIGFWTLSFFIIKS